MKESSPPSYSVAKSVSLHPACSAINHRRSKKADFKVDYFSMFKSLGLAVPIQQYSTRLISLTLT